MNLAESQADFALASLRERQEELINKSMNIINATINELKELL
jgi:hypothetical protein